MSFSFLNPVRFTYLPLNVVSQGAGWDLMLLFVWFTLSWKRVHPELEPTRKGGVKK